MYLYSIASDFPRHVFSQQQAFEGLAATDSFARLRPGSRHLLEKILLRQGVIEKRHFCTSEIEPLVECGAGELNQLFEREGTRVAAGALEKALAGAGLRAQELDALVICTCTGYLCPGLSSYVAETLGMRGDVYLQDIVGLGCGAAIPTLRAARGLCAAEPSMKVGVIAVELCSAAFYMDDDPGVLISLCLFGDGASASVWSGEAGGTGWRCDDFQTLHRPRDRELLRFQNKDGFLRNLLDRQVPGLAGEVVAELFSAAGMPAQAVVAHGGGKDVVDELERVLGGVSLEETRSVLRDYGNLSSPSVMVSLERRLASGRHGESLWLTSLGAGFAAHACSLFKND